MGCGTGYLLRLLATRCPGAVELVGVDPAAAMLDVAREQTSDRRITFAAGAVEHLLFLDQAFDLVVSTTSFDHWTDQQAGIAECARVLAPDGRLVITDLFSTLLTPTLARSRKRKARTKARAELLFQGSGLNVLAWHGHLPTPHQGRGCHPTRYAWIEQGQGRLAPSEHGCARWEYGTSFRRDRRQGPLILSRLWDAAVC